MNLTRQEELLLDRIALRMIELGEFDIKKAGKDVLADDLRITTAVIKARVSAADGFMLREPAMGEFIDGMAKRVYASLKH